MTNPYSKEFTYNGKRMRPYYRIWGLAVSDDGTKVLRYYEKDFGSSILPKCQASVLTIQHDLTGHVYIDTKDHGKLMIANMVAACFCPPRPTPQSDYELVHKDGNLANCNYKNLEWRKKQPVAQTTPHTAAKSIKIANGLAVHKDGTVYDKKEKLTVNISHYDSDTDLQWSHTPQIIYYRPNRWKRMEKQSADMDTLMEEAGYVDGERSDFTNPRILHKDYDWLNFKADNLEWCNASDQRYLDYLQKRKEDMNAWNKANNKDFPDMWLRT